MAEVMTLNQLLNDSNRRGDSSDFEQIELVRDKKLAKLKDRGSVIITNCKHSVADYASIPGDQTHKVYNDSEVPCPLCKKPSNLPLPIFPKSTTDALAAIKAPSDASVKSFLQGLLESIRSATISSFLSSNKPTNLQEINTRLASDREASNELFSKIISNEVLFHDLLETAIPSQKENNIEVEKILLRSTAEMLLYSNLYGLANSVTGFSITYHNLFLALRIKLLKEFEEEPSSDFINRILPLLGLVGNFICQTRYKEDSEEGKAAFINLDLEKSYCHLVVYLVKPFDPVLSHSN